MIRKHLAIALALVVGSAGAALAATAATAPLSSQLVRTLKDAPSCGGKGFSLITAPATKAGYLCVHNRFDPVGPGPAAFPQPRLNGVSAARGPATAKVPCYGDGQTGPRIQMIYGYYDGLPNRSKTVIAQMNKLMAPRMQAVINAQGLGRDLGLRFAMTPGCKAIDVKVIKFPESVQDATDPLDPGGQIGRAADYLASKGYDRADRKYQILWDGYNGGACGIGEVVILDPVTSAPVSPLNDGTPTLGARTAPPQVFTAKYSMIFNHAGGKNGPSCFERGQSGVTVQIHELFHTLGAVQLDAPHADTGHCFDAPSVMCSGGTEGYGLGIQIPA
ncbi:MAG: hypothetical protein ABIO67_04600, partial [Mycobacteriales bacterium]